MQRKILARTVEIKHICGHTEQKRICGYESCVLTQGSMERQIINKIRYFEQQNCLECRKQEGGASLCNG